MGFAESGPPSTSVVRLGLLLTRQVRGAPLLQGGCSTRLKSAGLPAALEKIPPILRASQWASPLHTHTCMYTHTHVHYLEGTRK